MFLTAPPIPPPPVPDFCYEDIKDQCVLCKPFQSPDYCPVDESFALLVQARKDAYRESDFDLEDYWFPYLDDKVGSYVFTAGQEFLTPQMYCCLTDAAQLAACLTDNVPSDASGYVIKATHFHTSQGVYVLQKQSGGDLYEVLRGDTLTLTDIVAELSVLGDTKIIVEELIGDGTMEAEYKLHAFPGEVVAIDIIDRRDPNCNCIAVVDPEWNRLDQFGCFVPTGESNQNADGSCSAIDFSAGSMNPAPVKNHLNLCVGDDLPRPEQCIVNDMIKIAETLSQDIGVYMRIDVFVYNGNVYVQEYSPNPINGKRHCVAKEENDCIDSCVMGRKWKAAGLPYGGSPTIVPAELQDYTTKGAADQCSIATGVTVNSSFISSCPAEQ